MRLERFYMAENKQKGQQLIFCTDKPFVVGVVYRIEANDTEAVEAYMKSMANGDRMAARVKGHTIFIALASTLERCTLGTDDIMTILRDMADFYLMDKIQFSIGGFNKYRFDNERIGRADASEYVRQLLSGERH